MCEQEKMWRIGALSPAKLAELLARAARILPPPQVVTIFSGNSGA